MGLFKEVKKAPLDLSDWSLSDFGLVKEVDEWASLIFVRVYDSLDTTQYPIGYIFVCDPKFGDRAQWKMPAGHATSKDKTPLHTACRELSGETGISLSLNRFLYCGKIRGPRGDHWRCVFTADMDYSGDLPWMNDKHPENEGEMQKYFSVDDFYRLVRERRFLRNHFDILESYALILPLGRDKK